jgi:protein pelota
MNVIYQDTKNGIIKLVPETLDDLWHLSHIIEPGDIVSSKTTRRIQDTTGERIRSDRGFKKTFSLGIKVEEINFHKFTGKLRANGTIEFGPEDLVPLGSYHTLDLKLNIPIKIKKEKWSKWNIKRLKDAIKDSKLPSAVIIAIEDDNADIGILRQYGIEYFGPIQGRISGKRIIQKNRKQAIIDFFNEIAKTVMGFKDIQSIIIVGPGFAKNNFINYLSENYPQQAKISVIESTGTAGRVGINEVLKKGLIEKLVAKGRIAYEMRILGKVLEEIGKSSRLVTYGEKEVNEAAKAGAVDKLLVLDELVRKRYIENIMDIVENKGGKVTIISSEHEGGKQLKALGGMAALLRYGLS